MSSPTGLLLPYTDPTTIAPPPANTAALVVNLSGQLTAVLPNGSIVPLVTAVGQHDSSLSTGNLTVTPTAAIHTESVAVTGAARISQILLSTVGLGPSNSGNRITLLLTFAGQAAAIQLQVYSSNSAGPLLVTFETDGVQNSAVGEFFYDATLGQWIMALSKQPATT